MKPTNEEQTWIKVFNKYKLDTIEDEGKLFDALKELNKLTRQETINEFERIVNTICFMDEDRIAVCDKGMLLEKLQEMKNNG